MRCFQLLVCLTLALALAAPAEAGGSYGSYGSYGSGGSSGGSSGGFVHGSSGGGLLSGLRARIAARHSGSVGGASSGGSSGGSYVASYASTGSSGGSIGGGGLFSRVRAHLQAKRAARGSSGGYVAAYSAGGASYGGSSGGGSYGASYGGASYGGASYGGASYGGGSSGGASYGGGSSGGYYSSNSVGVSSVSYGSVGGYSAPVSYDAPVSYGAPMIHSGYPVESYPSGVIMDSGSYSTEGSSDQGETSSEAGGAAVNGEVIDSGASYESRKPALAGDSALLTVAVPVESARVTVNGHETSSEGTVRQFMSRGLQEGYLYSYEVVVTYDVDGAEQRDTKTIKLRPGDMEQLVFKQDVEVLSPEAEPAPEAESAPEATDAVEPQADTNAEHKQDVTETVVQIHVPANAVVTLAGNETAGYGRVRTFRTTQLAAGEAWEDYTVVVTAKVNGRDIRNERTVKVEAGSTVELDFDFNANTLAMR